VEGLLEEKTDVSPLYDIVLEITEGVQDFKWTMRHATHDDIATMYVKKSLKAAKEAPDIDE